MVSHTSLGGLELSIGKGGLRFKKRPSAYNICIGKELRGEKAGDVIAWRDEFKKAVAKCSNKVKKVM